MLSARQMFCRYRRDIQDLLYMRPSRLKSLAFQFVIDGTAKLIAQFVDNMVQHTSSSRIPDDIWIYSPDLANMSILEQEISPLTCQERNCGSFQLLSLSASIIQ